MPDGRILSELTYTAEEIMEMSETEVRNAILRQDEPLTEPAFRAVERSVGREREKLEDYFDARSGADKWIKLGDEILPRWAEVVSEIHARREYAHRSDKEEKYAEALSSNLKDTSQLHREIQYNPTDEDLVEFVRQFRNIEDTYERDLE